LYRTVTNQVAAAGAVALCVLVCGLLATFEVQSLDGTARTYQHQAISLRSRIAPVSADHTFRHGMSVRGLPVQPKPAYPGPNRFNTVVAAAFVAERLLVTCPLLAARPPTR